MESILSNLKIKDLKIACILDDSAYEWFRYECVLIPIGLNDWQETIQQTKPDLLFVQSAWEGSKGQWKYKISNLHTKSDNSLKRLVDWCKASGIPTVFWNKEDPYHFITFFAAAQLFDYIFTTDSNCIQRYIEQLGHDRVYTLPFAAQPKIHNPIDKDREKLGQVAFCGSWYQNGHEERKKDMEIILKPALDYNLQIYDRMQNYTKDNNYKYPDIYKEHIVGSVPYREINNIYKKYDVVLNVNSVQDSPTMFASRVIELLACGINIVSGAALGLEKNFPDLIKLSRSEEETKKYLSLLLNNKELRDRLALVGVREALNKHTYKKRLEFMLDKIGVSYKKDPIPGVTIIACTNRQQYIDQVFDNYQRQSYGKKELIIILNKDSMPMELWLEKAKQYENVKVFRVEEKYNLGTCINFGVQIAAYDYICKMDDDDYYAPEYCSDAMNAFIYSDADIVGKRSHYVYFEDSNILALKTPNRENRFTNFVGGATLFIKKKVFDKIRFDTEKKSGTDTIFLEQCFLSGFKIYSADRFNHVLLRRQNTEDHTWKINQEDFLKNCSILCYTKDYLTHVTI